LISIFQDAEEYVSKRIRKLVEVIGKNESIIIIGNWSEWNTVQREIGKVMFRDL